MKRILFSVFALTLAHGVNSQIIKDTVTVGPGYGNNVWYSLENDEQGTQISSNWDIALASTSAQTSSLTASILFNHKKGTLYVIPGADVADFATVDTAGMVANGALYNSDVKWGAGAFNDITPTGQFDFGWGEYNMTSHSLDASRIFVIKYSATSYVKVMISLNTTAKKYTVTYADLNSQTPTVKEIDFTTFTDRNFIYFSMADNAIINREPASAAWDLTFMQYPTLTQGVKYMVAGALHNVGVEAVKVQSVDVATYRDWNAQTFSSNINTIGYDWKNNQGVVEGSLVYFVKAKTGDIWKVVFTGFVSGFGTGEGKYIFTKEKMSTLSVEDIDANVLVSLYPNPAKETATLVLDNKALTVVNVYNVLGALVYSTEVNAGGLQAVNIPVADLNNGIYHVVCTSNGKSSSQKLMIQK